MVTSSSSASATLKCTACRQVVSVDNSIACPVPECDRIFCIKRCSSKCIVHCAAPDCPDPNRCRLCASGQTHKLLQRYTSQEVSDIHEAFTPCDMPDCDATFCAFAPCAKIACIGAMSASGIFAAHVSKLKCRAAILVVMNIVKSALMSLSMMAKYAIVAPRPHPRTRPKKQKIVRLIPILFSSFRAKQNFGYIVARRDSSG